MWRHRPLVIFFSTLSRPMEDGLEELSCPAKEDAMEIPVSVRAAKLSDYAQLHPELELYGLSLGMRDGNEDWKKHTLTKQTHLMIESLSRWRGRQEWGRRFPGAASMGRRWWSRYTGPSCPRASGSWRSGWRGIIGPTRISLESGIG